jgi:hypothetical protein
MELTEEKFEKYQDELADLYEKGILEVRKLSPDGALFDFKSKSDVPEVVAVEEPLDDVDDEEDEELMEVLDEEPEGGEELGLELEEPESEEDMRTRLNSMTKADVVAEAKSRGFTDLECKNSKRRLINKLIAM